MIVFLTMPDRMIWERHVKTWESCVRCPLGEKCSSHVLGRGTLPADILFIGEAPGPEEDLKGQPFVGRSGKLLDCLIRDTRRRLRSRQEPSQSFTYFIANTLACYPDDGQGGFRAPLKTELEQCSPRVVDVTHQVQPKGIILLGKSALAAYNTYYAQFLKTWPGPTLHVYHPSYLLRRGGTTSQEYKETYDAIAKFLSSLPFDYDDEIPF